MQLAVEKITAEQMYELAFEDKLRHLSAVMAEILAIGNAREEAIRKLADAKVAYLLGGKSPERSAQLVQAKALYDALGLRQQTLKLFSSNLQTAINNAARAAGHHSR